MKHKQDIEGNETLKESCSFLRSSEDETRLNDGVFNSCDLDVTLRCHMTGMDTHFQMCLCQIVAGFSSFFVTLHMRYMLFYYPTRKVNSSFLPAVTSNSVHL